MKQSNTLFPRFLTMPQHDVVDLVRQLQGKQSPDERKLTVLALLECLDPDTAVFGRDIAVDQFLEAGGPAVVRLRLDSMDGNWRGEALNGTIDLLDKLARLPGLQRTFDSVSRTKAERISAAVEALHSHSEGQGQCIVNRSDEATRNVACQSGLDIVKLHEDLKSVREAEVDRKLGTRRKPAAETSGASVTAAAPAPCCPPTSD